MEPDRALAISTLKALIIVSEAEVERLHAILDDDAEDDEAREAVLKELATVLRNHHMQLDQLAELEAAS
jgi:hypothetical protein